MKACGKCNCVKSSYEFPKDKRTKDGLTTVCKQCTKVWKDKYVNKIDSEYGSRHKRDVAVRGEEYINKTRHRSSKYKSLNKDKIKAQNTAYRLRNKKAITERRMIFEQVHYTRLKSYRAFRAGLRRSQLLKATPFWSDLYKIREIYDKCDMLTKQSGVKHHVDHIVPLINELVCGLHVPQNLQILTAEENLKKNNTFIV